MKTFVRLCMLLLPLLAFTVIAISLPIKLWAFVTMNKQGWLTRTSDSIGGEGQSAASLGPPRQRIPVSGAEPAR